MAEDDFKIEVPAEYNSWLSKLIGPLTKKVTDRKAEVDVEMKTGFYQYCLRIRDRCGSMKTILSKGEQLDIKEFYVAPNLQLGRTIYDQDRLAKRLNTKPRIVITGTAGLGKSTFLKHFAISYTTSHQRPLPVFLELRELNDSKATIEESIFKAINTPKQFMTKTQFEYALQEGVVAFLLDAFDEIDFDIRDRYEKEIISLAARYPALQMVITSRPSSNESIEGLNPFEHVKLLPFDIEKVAELIRKSGEDTGDCERFIELVHSRLYESHESFLSTPLLALIMFLTFQVGGQIPDKLHEFYHRSFEALYYRHDNEKGAFSRKKYASLNRDEFLRMISAVRAVTYFEGNTVLNDFDFRKKIDAAKDIEGVSLDTEEFLNDLIESVCILQRDGTDVAFTHRSFQEYFTATFILNSEVLDTFGIINRLISRQGFDNVVFMIGEMNREFIEKKWVLRWLNLFYDKMRDLDCANDPVSYIRHMRYQGVIYYAGTGYAFGITGTSEDFSAMGAIIGNLYSKKYQSFAPQISNKVAFDKDNTKIVKYFAERDKLSLRRSKKQPPAFYKVKISDKDNQALAGTAYSESFEAQRKFLIALKHEIETRHKEKGENFMSLIRK